jgi:hypothetical protein
MPKKTQLFLLIVVVCALFTILGSSQVLADCYQGAPLLPKQVEIESTTGERLLVTYEPCSTVITEVQQWDSDLGEWVPVTAYSTLCIAQFDRCDSWGPIVPSSGCPLGGSLMLLLSTGIGFNLSGP